MLPHRPQVSHISRQQQSLCHGVGHISILPLLEVPNGRIAGQRSSVQHYGRGPSWNFSLVVTPPIHNSSFTRRSCLHDPGMFAPFMGPDFLGWKVLSLLHHLLSLLVWTTFLGMLPLAWDSNRSRRLVLILCCSTMASGVGEASWVWLT